MTDIITFITFNVLPFICLLGGLCWTLSSRYIPSAPEDEVMAWHEEVIPSPAPKKEAIALESLHLLFDEMETMGVELAYISCIPNSSEPLVVLEDDKEELFYGDTIRVVEVVKTESLPSSAEANDLDILELVADVVDNNDYLEVGGDESTFFMDTIWEEESFVVERREIAAA